MRSLIAAEVHAAPAAEAARPAGADCEQEPTSLARAACALALSLPGDGQGALIVAARALGDSRVALPPALTRSLTELLARKLGASAQSSAEALSLAEAQRISGRVRNLIYLSVSLYRDRLQVSAQVYGSTGHFWQRLRAPGLSLKRQALSTTSLDPELRALFPPIPLVISEIVKAALAERDPGALACGDLRGTGSVEIVMVGRRKVQVGEVVGGRFVPRQSLLWSDVSVVAGSPLREPIATASVPEPGRLLVSSSDRADALELSSTLTVQRKWPALVPWPGGGCTRRAGLGYEGRARPCPGTGAPHGSELDFTLLVDAFAGGSFPSASGRARVLALARPVGSNSARLLEAKRAEIAVPEVGAQLALGDLDQDGLPEIVSSLPTLDRRGDQLLVRTLAENGELRERLRIPIPSGIDALAICPGNGRSMAALVLSTGDEMWVVR